MGNTMNADRNAASAVATITAGVTVTGGVEAAADLQIGGTVNGDVRCHTLFLEEGGAINGDVVAERVRLAGAVEGTVEAQDVAVEQTGRVAGTITYARLKVGAGGVLEGTIKHRPVEPAVEGGNLKLVEAAEPAKPRRVFID